MPVSIWTRVVFLCDCTPTPLLCRLLPEKMCFSIWFLILHVRMFGLVLLATVEAMKIAPRVEIGVLRGRGCYCFGAPVFLLWKSVRGR